MSRFLRAQLDRARDNFYMSDLFRVVVADEAYFDLVDTIDDIIVIEEGPDQYDLRPRFHELGTARGLTVDGHTVSTHLHEFNTVAQVAEKIGNRSLLIAMRQKPDRLLQILLFSEAEIQPGGIGLASWKGEGSAVPVEWYWPGYLQVIEQIKP